MATYKNELGEREALNDASVNDLQKLANRKNNFKDSETYPQNKFVSVAANYEKEWRKNVNDDVTDQVEDVAPIGDKINYKGANYRLG